MPSNWYPVLYWGLVVLVTVLTGMMIALVLMLYSAIRSVVTSIAPVDL